MQEFLLCGFGFLVCRNFNSSLFILHSSLTVFHSSLVVSLSEQKTENSAR